MLSAIGILNLSVLVVNPILWYGFSTIRTAPASQPSMRQARNFLAGISVPCNQTRANHAGLNPVLFLFHANRVRQSDQTAERDGHQENAQRVGPGLLAVGNLERRQGQE